MKTLSSASGRLQNGRRDYGRLSAESGPRLSSAAALRLKSQVQTSGTGSVPYSSSSEEQPLFTRRGFIGTVAMAGAAAALGGVHSAEAASEATGASKNRTPIYFFSKPLDRFETEFMADTLAGAGLTGFDLTIRRGGKVLPERAETDLPKFAEAIRNRDLNVKMMVTDITGAGSPHAESVLKAASQAGIEHYRLGYFDFDFQIGVLESLQKHKAALQELAALNRTYRIQAGYQNHAGTRVGAAVWDLWELLRGLPAEQVSVQYDIRHAVAEGAASWVVGMRLLRPHIGSLAIKDFTWDVSSRRPRIVSVPLGEGIVDFDTYFRLVKELGIKAPISLHIEYPLLSRDEDSLPLLDKQRIMTAKLKHDTDYVRMQLAKHQIDIQ